METEDILRHIDALEVGCSEMSISIETLKSNVIENSELLNIRMDIIEQNQVELADGIETILLRLHSLDKNIGAAIGDTWCDSDSFNPLDDILKVMRDSGVNEI